MHSNLFYLINYNNTEKNKVFSVKLQSSYTLLNGSCELETGGIVTVSVFVREEQFIKFSLIIYILHIAIKVTEHANASYLWELATAACSSDSSFHTDQTSRWDECLWLTDLPSNRNHWTNRQNEPTAGHHSLPELQRVL